MPVSMHVTVRNNAALWLGLEKAGASTTTMSILKYIYSVVPASAGLTQSSYVSTSTLTYDGKAFDPSNPASVPKQIYVSSTFGSSRAASTYLRWLFTDFSKHGLFMGGVSVPPTAQTSDSRFVVAGMCDSEVAALADVRSFKLLAWFPKLDFATALDFSIAKSKDSAPAFNFASVPAPPGFVDTISVEASGLTCVAEAQKYIQQRCVAAKPLSITSSYVQYFDVSSTANPATIDQASLIRPQSLSCGLPVAIVLQGPYLHEFVTALNEFGPYALAAVPAKHALVTSSIVSVSSLTDSKTKKPREFYVHMRFPNSGAASKWLQFYVTNGLRKLTPSEWTVLNAPATVKAIVHGMCVADVAATKKAIGSTYSSTFEFAMVTPASLVQPESNFFVGHTGTGETVAIANMFRHIKNMSVPGAAGAVLAPDNW